MQLSYKKIMEACEEFDKNQAEQYDIGCHFMVPVSVNKPIIECSICKTKLCATKLSNIKTYQLVTRLTFM